MKRVALCLLLSLASLVACGDDEPSASSSSSSSGSTSGNGTGAKTTASSCDLTKDLGYCLDFAIGAPEDEAKNSCLGANTTGGYSGVTNETTGCPSAGRVGTCVATPASGVKTSYRYYGPKFTAATAEENCKTLDFGKFSP